jgi:hemoglobin/transferrin/lactoferrin receptor protein
MNRLFLVICLLFACNSLQAQIKIYVYDEERIWPLGQVKILVTFQNASGLESQKEFITRKDGFAELEEDSVYEKAQFILSRTGYDTTKLRIEQLRKLNFNVPLVPQLVSMDEITVTANRFNEKKVDIPRQLIILSHKEIPSLDPTTTTHLLENTGQVFVQRSQLGGGSPVLRGFEANRVLIVIDGVRLNNAIYRSGHLQNALRIHPLLLDRAEVVFGPGSVVYGSDALGGVMHFVTSSPQFSDTEKPIVESSALAGYQSAAQNYTAHAQVSIGLKKWAFLTGITYASFSDLVQGAKRNSKWGNLGMRDSFQTRINGNDTILANANRNKQIASAYNQVDILQKIRFRVSQKLEMGLNLQYSNTNHVPRYDRLTEINPNTGRLRFAEWYYGPELRTLVAFDIYHRKRTMLYDEWKTIIAYQYIEESRHNRTFKAPTRTNRYEKVQVLTLNSDAQKRIGEHELRYGIELTRNDVSSTANRENVNTGALSPQFTRYPDGGSNMHTAAFYISDAWELHPKWIVNGGIRYSYVNLQATFIDTTFFPYLDNSLTQNNHAANMQAGLIFMPSKKIRTYINLSSGFRAPNVDDVGKLFESAAGSQVVIPNPRLRPEYAWQTEAGANINPIKWLRWDFSGWYTLLNQAITTRPATLYGNDTIIFLQQLTRVVQQQNVQQAFIYGFSTDLRFVINKYVSVNNTISYTYGRIVTDTIPTPLDHIPPFFGRSGIQLMKNKFTGDLFVRYNGAKTLKDYNLTGEDNVQYATPNGTPSWVTLNVQAIYKFSRKQTETRIIAGVENIADNYYRHFASGISATGRNVYVTLLVRWK